MALGGFELRGEAVTIAEHPDAVPITLLDGAVLRHGSSRRHRTEADVDVPDTLARRWTARRPRRGPAMPPDLEGHCLVAGPSGPHSLAGFGARIRPRRPRPHPPRPPRWRSRRPNCATCHWHVGRAVRRRRLQRRDAQGRRTPTARSSASSSPPTARSSWWRPRSRPPSPRPGPPLEILLSDDCSPDGTFAVMQAMAAAYAARTRSS